jgi:hypothetical protein
LDPVLQRERLVGADAVEVLVGGECTDDVFAVQADLGGKIGEVGDPSDVPARRSMP